MSAISFIQLIAACIGIIGSIFFAVGIMRQTVEAMARLSGTYWDWNPCFVTALAAQKADYLFGGGLISISFLLQLASFFASSEPLLSPLSSKLAPWIACISTFIIFFILRFTSNILAKDYEAKITNWLQLRSNVKNSAA